MPVGAKDDPKTAVITPFGLLEFLRNAGQSFQRFLELDCIFVYLDNILVAINTEEEHHIHLEEVLK